MFEKLVIVNFQLWNRYSWAKMHVVLKTYTINGQIQYTYIEQSIFIQYYLALYTAITCQAVL